MPDSKTPAGKGGKKTHKIEIEFDLPDNPLDFIVPEGTEKPFTVEWQFRTTSHGVENKTVNVVEHCAKPGEFVFKNEVFYTVVMTALRELYLKMGDDLLAALPEDAR